VTVSDSQLPIRYGRMSLKEECVGSCTEAFVTYGTILSLTRLGEVRSVSKKLLSENIITNGFSEEVLRHGIQSHLVGLLTK
jgi:hypothetical protein